MANIKLEHLKKIYRGNKNYTVVDFNLEVKNKEFVVLVGGSGCGKSTTLRMIAGLEDITEGNLYFDDKKMNDVPTGKRNIAMVFQSYALYPHMNVFKNIAFPLVIKDRAKLRIKEEIDTEKKLLKRQIKTLREELTNDPSTLDEEIKKMKERNRGRINNLKEKITEERRARKEEIKERVEKVATIVGLEQLLHRKPKQLSGGQRQRVALARAIVKDNIKVLLMDEPLSNLDAKLRVEMRTSIIKLHEELGLTIIYVTHDQVEAMTMANKIVVMNKGIAQQIGSPVEIYERPNNLFVASFIGTPSMNFMKGTLTADATLVIDQETKINLPDETYQNLKKKGYLNQEIIIGIRPGDIAVNPAVSDFKGTVEVAELLGDDYNLHVKIGPYKITVKTKVLSLIRNHDVVNLSFDLDKAHFFDMKSQLRIRSHHEK